MKTNSEELKQVTPQQRDDFYEQKKKQFNDSVEKFNNSNDAHDLVDVFNLMVVIMRCSGMNFKEIQKFLKANTNQRFEDILTLHKELGQVLQHPK